MDSFKSYLFHQVYKEVETLGDRLAEVEPLIDLKTFRPIVVGLYENDDSPGRPPQRGRVGNGEDVHTSGLYDLSDQELERQAAD